MTGTETNTMPFQDVLMIWAEQMLFVLIAIVISFFILRYFWRQYYYLDSNKYYSKWLSHQLKTNVDTRGYNPQAFSIMEANLLSNFTRVVIENNKVTILVPIKLMWMFNANDDVLDIIFDRLEAKSFRRILQLRFGQYRFDNEPILTNRFVVLKGSKVN